MEARFGRRESRLESNVVAALHVYVTPAPAHGSDKSREDSQLAKFDKDHRRRFEVALRDRVSRHLGPEFDAEITELRPGSVEIVALILLAGSLVGTYNTVREGLRNVREDWSGFVRSVIDPLVSYELDVDAFYRLGPVMENLPTGAEMGMIGAATPRTLVTPRRIRVPERLVTLAAGLLFLVLLGWLVVPLLLLADVL